MEAMNRLWVMTMAALSVLFLGFMGWALFKTATTSVGRIDFCYIDHTFGNTPQPYWIVYGHVPWHRDMTITRTTSFDEAVRVRDTQCGAAVDR